MMHDSCPICECKISTLYKHKNRTDLVDSFDPSSKDIGIFYDLLRCDMCHSVYAKECPDKDEMSKLYCEANHDGYTAEETNRRKNFENLLESIRKLVPIDADMLDVGCATGIFLDAAQKLFPRWKVSGVEASASAVDTCMNKYGIKAKRGMFENMETPTQKYDIVTMLDVIEHASDPMAMVQKANSCLVPNGLLVVTTPNIGSWTARLFGRRWWGFRRMHTLYFSRLSMRQMLARGGFRVIQTRGLVRFFSITYCLQHLGWITGCSFGGFAVPLALGDMMVVARKENCR